jgi:uncharacterized protein (TIGR04255 family)
MADATVISKQLPRAPLVFALAHIRFTPVLKMEDFLPDVQEYLRLNGFPEYEQREARVFTLGIDTKEQSSKWWEFSDTAKRRQIVLTTESVSAQTTEYSTFDDFLEMVSQAIKPLAEHVKVAMAKQIGLRFVDLLADIDHLRTPDLLAPGLRGISAREVVEGADQSAMSFVLQIKTPHGVLSIRSVQMLGLPPYPLPPDLSQVSLSLPEWVDSARSPRVLDFDHVMHGDFEFLPDELRGKLRLLHDFTGKAFRAVVAKEALDAWGRSSRGVQ